MKKGNFFWIGYSDLITSLFFILLVLYVVTFVKGKLDQQTSGNRAKAIGELQRKVSSLEDQNEALEKVKQKLTIENENLATKVEGLEVEVEKFNVIKNVEEALSTLDRRYYYFDQSNKRYKLNIDVQFPSNSADINRLSIKERHQLERAGRELYNKVKALVLTNKDIEYLLVIEGNTERFNNNFNEIPNVGYRLSYNRALALYNFWTKKGIDFNNLNKQCEVIIAGSGYFGQSREAYEPNNKRFSIQVTSKVGKFLHSIN